jgi:hypothetical protein
MEPCIEPAGSRQRLLVRAGRPCRAISEESTMKNPRPVLATATLGTTLLLGACFGGQSVAPGPAPSPAPSTVVTVPDTGTQSPQPKAGKATPDLTPPPVVAPPAPAAPLVAPPAPAPPLVAPPAPAPPLVAPPAPAPPPVRQPALRAPLGNDHDADNNGGPSDGDGNK